MAKRAGGTPEEDVLDWFNRMDFTPEELIDIWSARSALARQLEGSGQYPGTAAQMRAVDWYVENVSRPSMQAGIRATLGWHPLGYWETRYAIRGLPGLFGWTRAKSIIFERTGVTPTYPYMP